MTLENEEIGQKLDERAKFEKGDLFHGGEDSVVAVYQRWYDFDKQKFYYRMKDPEWDWKTSDSETPFQIRGEDEVKRMGLVKANDEIADREEYNIDDETVKIAAEELEDAGLDSYL